LEIAKLQKSATLTITRVVPVYSAVVYVNTSYV